jgi:DNA-binding response OmpR family regulator
MPGVTLPKKILIVEDDPNLNSSLKRRFERNGFEAIACYDGQQALDVMDRQPCDCLLLDLMMPVKDGFAVLAKKPSTRCAAAPAYVLTTMGQDEELQLARELGAKDVFLKSETSASQVVDAIKKDLGVK